MQETKTIPILSGPINLKKTLDIFSDFEMRPLPLHSKLKNGIQKFFIYVTTNQN